VVTGRTLEKCEITADMLRERGVKSLALKCDVKSAKSLQTIVDKTIEEFGQLDILVNNAQEVARGPLLAISDEQISNSPEPPQMNGEKTAFRSMPLCPMLNRLLWQVG